MSMFEWCDRRASFKIDEVWVLGKDLAEFNSDLTCAVAAWRRFRRERKVLDDILEETNKTFEVPSEEMLPTRTLIEQVSHEIDKEIISELVTCHNESRRDINLIALKCRMRELHGIGRPKGRRHL